MITYNTAARRKARLPRLNKDYAIESSITGIAIASLHDERLVYANPAFVKMFGYSNPCELVGRHPSELCVNPQDAYAIFEHLQSHDRWIGELDGRKKDGAVITTQFSGNLVRDGHGKPISMLASLVDITRLKRSEERAQWLSGIMHMSHSEIFVFDTETLHVIEANKVALLNTGYSMDELRQMTSLILNPSLTHEGFEKLVSPLRNKQQDRVVFETCHQRKDGSTYPVEVRLHIIQIQEAKPAFVAVILDITARKIAEEQIQKAKEEAENGNMDKSRSLAAARHDIKQPLHAASLFASVLLHRTADLEFKEILERQLLALSSLGTMLDRLLDGSQLDTQSSQVKPPSE